MAAQDHEGPVGVEQRHRHLGLAPQIEQATRSRPGALQIRVVDDGRRGHPPIETHADDRTCHVGP